MAFGIFTQLFKKFAVSPLWEQLFSNGSTCRALTTWVWSPCRSLSQRLRRTRRSISPDASRR
ncbi:hypothetical protein BN2476_590111 [Paraburkholderia piptadeniae]|uniref:Uncharacterized protein n=1 Tax=Paraburkholderia piptadeniae TaxID=1701573 RepID=A0A1N7SK28_9BURK|nr:hypothetical protein BN2476_590111 [Paraburkholderia piptadeniae]